MYSILGKAIEAVQQAELSYCKYLSANDTKSTKAHQAGYLISKAAWKLFLPDEPIKGQNIKRVITIIWQDDFQTSGIFTYYGAAKNEFRLTGFGRNFPYREEENTGDLFVLCKVETDCFKAFILSHDEDIDDFFAAVNISATETNKIIPKQQENPENELLKCFSLFINSLKVDFPATHELAANARNCYKGAYNITSQYIRENPDNEIIRWIDAEYQLFKAIENNRYAQRILKPFASVEELVDAANTILNRRKSRAGKSLEHHLAEMFTIFGLAFETQAITEDKKKPDFLFPGIEAYLNPKFDDSKLIVLASKTTCKDRWRQILNEADRVKTKHLFTLQQGISTSQLEEMYKYNVRLVVPKGYLEKFPKEFRERILTLDSFINLIKFTQPS